MGPAGNVDPVVPFKTHTCLTSDHISNCNLFTRINSSEVFSFWRLSTWEHTQPHFSGSKF